MAKADWTDAERDLQDPSFHNKTQGQKKAHKTGQTLLKATPETFTIKVDWTIMQSCNKQKDETIRDFGIN